MALWFGWKGAREMGWRVGKADVNYSSLKESVEVPGSGLGMG